MTDEIRFSTFDRNLLMYLIFWGIFEATLWLSIPIVILMLDSELKNFFLGIWLVFTILFFTQSTSGLDTTIRKYGQKEKNE